MSDTNNSHKWSLLNIHPTISTHSTRDILCLSSKSDKSMGLWYYYSLSNNGYCISRIRIAMGPDIFLGGHRNYRSPLRHPHSGRGFGDLNLRGALSFPTNTKPLLLSTLPPPPPDHSNNINSPHATTRKGLLKPNNNTNSAR